MDVLMTDLGLSLLSQHVALKVVDFLVCQRVVLAAAEHDDATCHLEEHCALEHFVEGLAANHLTMLQHESRVVVLQRCLNSLCKLG